MPSAATRDRHAEALALVTDAVIARFERDGAVWIEGLLSPSWMRLIEQGIARNRGNPGPLAKMHCPGEEGEFFDDFCNFGTVPEYQVLIAESPIAAVMAKLLRSEKLWLFCDQIFIKEGYSQRTGWHQDLPYWIADGDRMATMWIAAQPLSEDETLEFVAGSFRHCEYDHRPADQQDGSLPRRPDIEADRSRWPIVSRASRPGDVMVFHPGTLHSGGGMRAGSKRHSLGLRFFGDGTTYAERPIPPDPAFPGVSETLRPGDALVHAWFPQVYPRPSSSRVEFGTTGVQAASNRPSP